MKREILTTQDGSTTIHLPDWNESYHSKHGAIQEAYHVFIKNGLSLFAAPARKSAREGKSVSILEIGFGTGLNAFITYLEADQLNQNIAYTGVEAYPILLDEVLQMNYVSALNVLDKIDVFNAMHQAEWGEK